MSELADKIRHLVEEPLPTRSETEEVSVDDEIIEALRRQLDVLTGTVVILSNIATVIMTQVDNLRAELELFDAPASPPATPAPPQRDETKVTPSGAKLVSSLPEEQRPDGACTHPDALLIDMADGQHLVCPDCDGDQP